MGGCDFTAARKRPSATPYQIAAGTSAGGAGGAGGGAPAIYPGKRGGPTGPWVVNERSELGNHPQDKWQGVERASRV